MNHPSPPRHPPACAHRASLRRPCAAVLLGIAVALAPGAWSPPATAQSSLPALGDASAGDMSPAAERQLGERIMREIRRDPAYLHDAVLQDYLDGIWHPLLDAARQRGDLPADLDDRLAWEVFKVRDRAVNAFALPGGYIGVHLGLLAVTATRDELASVMAHELAHVTQRHIARSIAGQRQQTLMSVAAMILGVVAASRSPGAAEALIVGGQAAAIASQLSFSREMEREADRIGFGVMTQAGFAPAGMAAMFHKLAEASRLNDTGAYPYLRSHPLTVDRIGEAQARLGLPEPAAAAAREDVLSPARMLHATMQARARVLMDRSSDAQRSWAAPEDAATGTRHDANDADRLWQQYGAALNAALARDWPRADAALERARALAAPHPPAARAVALLGAEVAVLRGEPGPALSALDALEPAPATAADGVGSARALMLLTADAAALPGSPAAALTRAADRLQPWTITHPQDAPAWHALASVWRAAGQPLRSLRAQAEAHLAEGDVPGGVERLRAAQRQARSGQHADFVEASIIDARLRQAETLLREQELQRQRGG